MPQSIRALHRLVLLPGESMGKARGHNKLTFIVAKREMLICVQGGRRRMLGIPFFHFLNLPLLYFRTLEGLGR